jgi:hypothetical protein
VFYLFEPEEALTWDSPNQILALAHAGIESMAFENQPYVIQSSADNIAVLKDFSKRLRSQSA